MAHATVPIGVTTPAAELEPVSSSEAKKDFASLIRQVAHTDQPVVITRHNQPAAVLLSVDAYERMVAAVPDPLAALRQDFDRMLAAMQTSAAKTGVDALFAATPVQLGAAAVKAARHGGS